MPEIIEGYSMVRTLGEMLETLRRAEARRLDEVDIKHPHPFPTGKGMLQSNGRFGPAPDWRLPASSFHKRTSNSISK